MLTCAKIRVDQCQTVGETRQFFLLAKRFKLLLPVEKCCDIGQHAVAQQGVEMQFFEFPLSQ